MSPTIPYTLVRDKDTERESLTVFGPSGPVSINDDHPQFQEAVEAARSGDGERACELADLSVTVANRFQRLTERVSVANGRVYFDGDELHNALSKHLLRVLSDGEEDWQPLVRFMENLAANPQPHSREQLYEWLDRRDFTITEDGCIIGYKGVAKQADGSLVSVNRGPAVVDGEPVNGAVPNEVGSVVELGRAKVQHDAAIGCASGLHVGTYNYARGWARGALLRVKVNPRDVVSVPTDCDAQKVRVCRYEVEAVIDAPETSPIFRSGVSGDTGVRDEDDYYGDPYYS